MQFRVTGTNEGGEEVTLYEGPDPAAAQGIVDGVMSLAAGGSYTLAITTQPDPAPPQQGPKQERQPRPGTTQQR